MSIPGTEMYFCQTICYFRPMTGRHGADMPRCPLNAADGPIYACWLGCFIPPKDNTELKQTFAQYGVNTPRSGRFGSNVRQRVNCLDATYVHGVFFKNDINYGGFWAKNDISYGGHFRRIGNPVNVKAWRFLQVFLVYVFNKLLKHFLGVGNDFKRPDQQIFTVMFDRAKASELFFIKYSERTKCFFSIKLHDENTQKSSLDFPSNGCLLALTISYFIIVCQPICKIIEAFLSYTSPI